VILPSIIQEIFVTLTIGKNQTVDQAQDELIAWMEDANRKIEKIIAIQKQKEIDEELERSTKWASVIQKCQTNVI